MRLFPYFGAKVRLAPKYPAPRYRTIIEPFAGSAAYAQLHHEHTVVLYDVDPLVVGAWRFAIQASRKEVDDLPNMKYGDDVGSYPISPDARCFMQLFTYDGLAGIAGRLAGKRCVWNKMRSNAAELIGSGRFRHWQIFQQSYSTIANKEATWFIDPPYQFGGENYASGQPDYAAVSKFCKTRRGQTIVCENTKATWLPFRPLAVHNGIKHQTVEAIWTNE